MRTVKIYLEQGSLVLEDLNKTVKVNPNLVVRELEDGLYKFKDAKGTYFFEGDSFDLGHIVSKTGTTYTEEQFGDFFVKAPFSGGYPIVESSVSGTKNIALQFCKAIVQTNTLVSTDIFTLTLAPTTSTGIGEYIYSFTTGATAPTIVWPIECKESIVISPNKKYLISFVRVSATKVFTFIDEEIV